VPLVKAKRPMKARSYVKTAGSRKSTACARSAKKRLNSNTNRQMFQRDENERRRRGESVKGDKCGGK